MYEDNTVYRRIRLHAPLLDIGKGKHLNDRCKECRTWDACVEPAVVNLVHTGMQSLEAVMPPYFKKIGPICQASGFNEPEFEKIESPHWLAAMYKFILDHPSECADERAECTRIHGDVWHTELIVAECSFSEKLPPVIQEVAAYAGHWTVRNWLRENKLQEEYMGQCGTMVMESDWGSARP